MNPSAFFDVLEDPAGTIKVNVDMVEAHVGVAYSSNKQILNGLEETQSPPHFDAVGNQDQVLQIHIGHIAQALAQVLDAWAALPSEGEAEDRKDVIDGLRYTLDIVHSYLSEGVFNSHDVSNRVNVLMHADIFDVAARMKSDAAAIIPALLRFSRFDLPVNIEAFYPILDLPQGTRVLVVEDQQNVIDLVKYQVGDRGTVVSALTPKDLPGEGEFDLILLDWYWGHEIGGNYIKLLKQRFPSAVIIGHSSSSNRQKYFGEIPACNKGGWFELYMKASGKA